MSFSSNIHFQGSGVDYWVDINDDGIVNIKIRTLNRYRSPKLDLTENYEGSVSSNRLQKLHQLMRYIDPKAAKDLDGVMQLTDGGSYHLEIKDQDGNTQKALYLSQNFPSMIKELLDTESKKELLEFDDLPKGFDIEKSIESCKAFNIFLGFISRILPTVHAKVIKFYYP